MTTLMTLFLEWDLDIPMMERDEPQSIWWLIASLSYLRAGMPISKYKIYMSETVKISNVKALKSVLKPDRN